MSKVPPPPFPFPKRWEQVAAIQAKYVECFWLPCGRDVETNRSSDKMPGKANSAPSASWHSFCDDTKEDEVLVVNTAWVERLGGKRKHESVDAMAVASYLEQRKRAMQAQTRTPAEGMSGSKKPKTARQMKKSARKRPPPKVNTTSDQEQAPVRIVR